MDSHLLVVVLQVAKVAREKWLEVGLALGFEMEELDEFKEREQKRFHSRLLRLLVNWNKKVDHWEPLSWLAQLQVLEVQ